MICIWSKVICKMEDPSALSKKMNYGFQVKSGRCKPNEQDLVNQTSCIYPFLSSLEFQVKQVNYEIPSLENFVSWAINLLLGSMQSRATHNELADSNVNEQNDNGLWDKKRLKKNKNLWKKNKYIVFLRNPK